MSTSTEIEKDVLSLPPEESERIALAAWQSLDFDSPSELDPEGIKLANIRDEDMTSGHVEPIDHDEFIRRTGGGE